MVDRLNQLGEYLERQKDRCWNYTCALHQIGNVGSLIPELGVGCIGGDAALVGFEQRERERESTQNGASC